MKLLDLKQGSDEWLEARLKYLCASEAPAMMGDSKFMSRNQLLALKKGWKSNPIDGFKKKLFEKGHLHEDMAREHIEIMMCEDIPPAVGLNIIDGLELLSSFDGYSLSMIWEHKDWNQTLAENVRNKVLEPLYFWQLEHQMLTAGTNSVLFTVSDGTLDNRVSMTYESVPDRRKDVVAGWKQFLVDLDAYEIAAKQEVVVANNQEKLPSIECRVEGSEVVSNLGSYIPVIEKLAQDQMSIVLETDQDFADKEAFNKNVKEGRASLKLKASEIETAFESLAEFNGYVKQADAILQKLQSHGEKQVKDAKETKKLAIKNAAQSTIQNHISNLSETIDGFQISGYSSINWDEVIKGKRSFEKMKEAVDAEIAQVKIEANELADVIRKNLNSLKELASEHKFLFHDQNELVLKSNDDLVNLIKMRISDHKQAEEIRLEEERKRIQQEEEEKAEAKAEADREKIRKEEQKKLQEESKPEAKANIEPEPEPEKPTTENTCGSAITIHKDSFGGAIGRTKKISINVPESKHSALISLLMDQMNVTVISDSEIIIN